MKRLACCCLLLGMSMHLAAENAVRYRDHGAVGDGKADDFEALVKAHEDANKRGLPVKADDGATYYIGGAKRTIAIQTDTDFGSARFIIDDTALESHRPNVFEVQSSLKPIQLKEVASFKKDQRQLSVKLPQACLVMASNDGVKRFIRRGLNVNDGSPQTDVFLVDRNGLVDPSAPIIWDFNQITKIEALPLDARSLTITGGKFTTIANQSDGTSYHARGIAIRRSNVVVDGLEHRIEGEGESGAPYSGFIHISQCANVMVKNSIFTGHKIYKKSDYTQKHPYVITREVIYRGVTTTSGKPLRVSKNDVMFKDVKVRDMTGG